MDESTFPCHLLVWLPATPSSSPALSYPPPGRSGRRRMRRLTEWRNEWITGWGSPCRISISESTTCWCGCRDNELLDFHEARRPEGGREGGMRSCWRYSESLFKQIMTGEDRSGLLQSCVCREWFNWFSSSILSAYLPLISGQAEPQRAARAAWVMVLGCLRLMTAFRRNGESWLYHLLWK